MAKLIVRIKVTKSDVQKLHVQRINSNVKMANVLVSHGAVMEKSTVRLEIARMKMTVTEIAQIPFVSRTIFNVPIVKIAFQPHGSGKFY